MTLKTVMEKTRLAAFADGELSPEEAAEVVMHLADHPQDQTYVDALLAANETLATAFAAPISEPVPPGIEQAIMGPGQSAEVIPFRRKPVLWAGAALAASLVFVLVGLPHLTGPEPAAQGLALGPVEAASELGHALETLPTGVPSDVGSDGALMILATLPVEDGFCREVELIQDGLERIDLGIACRDEAGWSIEVTLSEPLSATGTEDGFVTASGAELQGLQPFLDRLGAGVALDAVAEATAMAQGWRP